MWLRNFLILVLCASLSFVSAKISDKRLCADPKCEGNGIWLPTVRAAIFLSRGFVPGTYTAVIKLIKYFVKNVELFDNVIMNY